MSRATIDEAFESFHVEHPEVYDEIVRLAREMKTRGHQRGAIDMPFNLIRWDRTVVRGDNEFALDNNFRSRYARRIMMREPDLAGFFEIRALRAA